MIFLFPRWDMLIPWRVFYLRDKQMIKFLIPTQKSLGKEGGIGGHTH